MAGFKMMPRSKESCHCRTRTGLGAMSQVGMERTDMLRMLPVGFLVRSCFGKGGCVLLSLMRNAGPPEQNAEAVMPTVWAMRIAAGRGAIATRCSDKLVGLWVV